MGAIGIARAFAYGGAKGQAIYDPTVKPTEHRTAEAYLKGAPPSTTSTRSCYC
jgi:uncharacterized protein